MVCRSQTTWEAAKIHYTKSPCLDGKKMWGSPKTQGTSITLTDLKNYVQCQDRNVKFNQALKNTEEKKILNRHPKQSSPPTR